MHISHASRTAITVVPLALGILLLAPAANAQTAACCIGDVCQELEQAPCEAAGGQWLGALDPPVADCAGDPCSTGACCQRDLSCNEQWTLGTCADVGGVYFPYRTCDLLPGGGCSSPDNDDCDTDGDGTPDGATQICAPEEMTYYDAQTPESRLGQCADWPGAAGFGEICHPTEQDCIDPPDDPPGTNPCLAHMFEAYECYVPSDNRLATTDGPPPGGDCIFVGEEGFQADVWYRINAPCVGAMVVTQGNRI